MKVLETRVRDFTGGITNDPRDESVGVAQIYTNLDIFTDTRRAIPYRDVEDGNSGQTSNIIQAYCVALRTGTTYSLYGLGVDAGHPQVFYKNLTTGAANDLDDNSWNTTANNLSTGGSTSYDCFVYYPKTGRIYGGRLSGNIWKYDPSGSAAFTETELSISYTHLAQGIVHSQDDVLYIPYDNIIAANDNGSWNATAFTGPDGYYITSICEYGAFLAIAFAPLSGVGVSRVLLWDRDTTTNLAQENIDWGTGDIRILENIENTLIGISTTQVITSIRYKHRVTFRRYDGYGAVKFMELTSASSPDLRLAKQKLDNRVHFLMSITLNGAVREGIWTLGRSNPNKPFALAHSHTPNNDTALGNGGLKGFFILGDYVFTSFTDNSSVQTMTKTVSTATYTKKAIIETVIYNTGDSSITKTWKGYASTFEPLTSSAQVVSKYKIDADSSYGTTIQTASTSNALSQSSATVDNAGSLPEHKELSLRLESTNGAVITGYSFEQGLEDSKSY